MPLPRHDAKRREGGFSLTEIAVTMAIIAVIAIATMPQLISYWRSNTLRGGAEELGSILTRARSIAISTNQFVCVQIVSGSMRFRTASASGTVCTGGTIFVGTGTDPNGLIPLTAGTSLSTSADPIFTSLGAANTTANFTVTDPQTGQTMPVTVSVTGRIKVGT